MNRRCEEVTTIVVCQGVPRCELTGDDAIAEQVAGCPWCNRIVIDEDGAEQTEGPGNA